MKKEVEILTEALEKISTTRKASSARLIARMVLVEQLPKLEADQAKVRTFTIEEVEEIVKESLEGMVNSVRIIKNDRCCSCKLQYNKVDIENFWQRKLKQLLGGGGE